MVRGPTVGHDERMTALIAPPHRDPGPVATGGRDPAHELYEHAAGLLAAAHALEAAAHAPGAVAAISPTLACLEAALGALAETTERLRGQALERLSEPMLPNEDLRAQRAEIALHLERLAGVLEQASQVSTSARGAIEPVLGELTVV
jgi:hypothetical protein